MVQLLALLLGMRWFIYRNLMLSCVRRSQEFETLSVRVLYVRVK